MDTGATDRGQTVTTIRFRCHICGTSITATTAQFGREGRCPSCGNLTRAPEAAAQPAPAAAPAAAPSAGLQGRKILVVDDDGTYLELLGGLVRRQGGQVIVARDVIAAVSMARRERPDLILLDILMPGGDGYAVLERLQHMDPTRMVPVIVVSSRPAADERDKATGAGAAEYVEKPFAPAELMAKIEAVLYG